MLTRKGTALSRGSARSLRSLARRLSARFSARPRHRASASFLAGYPYAPIAPGGIGQGLSSASAAPARKRRTFRNAFLPVLGKNGKKSLAAVGVGARYRGHTTNYEVV